MAVKHDNLESGIEDIVRREIHSSDVIDVFVDRGEDIDGDLVFFIHVVFDGKGNRVDARESIAVRRQVRDMIAKSGENISPQFYYVAKAEAERLAESR